MRRSLDSGPSIHSQTNNCLLESLEKLEPYGKGNHEPYFIINDLKIDSIKIIKNKHILIFFENDLGNNIKGICFNSKGTILGDYLEKFNKYRDNRNKILDKSSNFVEINKIKITSDIIIKK